MFLAKASQSEEISLAFHRNPNTLHRSPLNIEQDFVYKVVEEDDTKTANLKVYFEECFKFIDEGRSKGGVVVHCLQGVSRSATVVVAYIMNLKGAQLKQAFNYVAKLRPKIYPNPGFRAQLLVRPFYIYIYIFLVPRATIDLSNANRSLKRNW